MKECKYNLSILLIFFARPETLKKVFDEIKKARPAKLFLACDGARENVPGEIERVEECKKIVSDIDWDCEVFKHYSDENLGCGKGPKTAISWAFEHTDQLVIMEDDCVPAESFFSYMEEMLNYYKNDSRIGIISGFNHFYEWNCGNNSYCFTKYGATLGWGTWKRVWEKYDFHVDLIKDEYCKKLIKKEISNKKAMQSRLKSWQTANVETYKKKVNYWDIQFGFVKYSQSYLCVVPKTNLIYNIGVGLGSTHTEQEKKKEWKLGQVLFMPTKDLCFPLHHPKYVICDREYDKKCFKKVLHKSFVTKVVNKLGRMIKK